MIPVVTLVGRPNVGKSTLFNKLTRSRQALVDNFPGVTRDRLYGNVTWKRKKFILIDTGGISADINDINQAVQDQVSQALAEADLVLFVADCRDGLTPSDFDIAQDLRKNKFECQLVVNKTEGIDTAVISAEFHELAIGAPLSISAKNGQGIEALLDVIVYSLRNIEGEDSQKSGSSIAVVGRPNVGKSTMINTLAGTSRLIVADVPGTTRDSVIVPVDRFGQKLNFIDTAGVRRKARVQNTLEKFSVVKTIQSLASADAAIMVMDAQQSISDQDSAIAGLVVNSGRSFLLVVNKWDGLDIESRANVKRQIKRKFTFLPKHNVVFISALHKSGIRELMARLREVISSAYVEIGTGHLNRALRDVLKHHSPPLVNNRTIKPKFAHQGGKNPPVIVLHGNSLDKLPETYLRYLRRSLSAKFSLIGTHIRIELRNSDNPYNKSKRPKE